MRYENLLRLMSIVTWNKTQQIRWSEQRQAEAVPPGQALKYVSFAVQMLGKSFKMLPVTGKKLGGGLTHVVWEEISHKRVLGNMDRYNMSHPRDIVLDE